MSRTVSARSEHSILNGAVVFAGSRTRNRRSWLYPGNLGTLSFCLRRAAALGAGGFRITFTKTSRAESCKGEQFKILDRLRGRLLGACDDDLLSDGGAQFFADFMRKLALRLCFALGAHLRSQFTGTDFYHRAVTPNIDGEPLASVFHYHFLDGSFHFSLVQRVVPTGDPRRFRVTSSWLSIASNEHVVELSIH
jgi:hypothetical protein